MSKYCLQQTCMILLPAPVTVPVTPSVRSISSDTEGYRKIELNFEGNNKTRLQFISITCEHRGYESQYMSGPQSCTVEDTDSLYIRQVSLFFNVELPI